jgi:biopolymer transport protein ExbB/TolQ
LFRFNQPGKKSRFQRVFRHIPPGHNLVIRRRSRAVSRFNTFATSLIRSPLLWGMALACGFFKLIHDGVIADPLVVRYLAGNWIEYVEVGMFFIGMAALAGKAIDVAWQWRGVADEQIDPIPDGGQDATEAASLLASLPEEEQWGGAAFLVRRLREALDFVARTGSADGLEDHLKYLSDVDAARAARSYGLVRFIVWAIPIMGFLGTVIGITVAIANLSPTQLENISGVVAGLGTAFDTTATALGLSMVLMFVQFLVDRSEQSLLAEVDVVAWETLAGRFQSGPTAGNASLLGVIDHAGNTLRVSLEKSIHSVLAAWTESLTSAQAGLLAEHEDRWAAAAESLATAMRAMETQHAKIAGQTELLASVVQATRDLTTLEKSLNDNLATLAASGRFEEVLATLAASTQLLAARAGAVGAPRAVELSGVSPSGKAA